MQLHVMKCYMLIHRFLYTHRYILLCVYFFFVMLIVAVKFKVVDSHVYSYYGASGGILLKLKIAFTVRVLTLVDH